MLWIDGNNVVSNNAFQGLTTRSGTISLSAGLHDIVVAYYQGNNTYGLYADVILPGGSSQRLPNSLLQFGSTAFAIGSLSGEAGSTLNLSNYPLAISQTTDGAFAGTISGTGSLTKIGAGELTLSGSNTFTGSTTVNAGTLTLDYRTQNNNKISTDASLFLNGATLKILGHASTLFTQRVSGLVLMSNAGASTVINQSGNTVLDFTSGNLSLGSGVSVNFRITGGAGVRLPGTTNTLFGPWAVMDTGDPSFLNANNFVVPLSNYDGVLPASGADPAKNYLNTVGTVTNSEIANLLNFRDAPLLSISNGAVLHLNFGLLFPGLTALSINGGGQLGASNVTLVINTSASLGTNALTIGAPISAGSGALSKLGPGTLIVTNNNTYTGGTTISAGMLQVGNGGNRGTLGPGSVTDNGTLVYNRSDAVAITNSITGNGVLVQAGTNTLSINTPQSYSGGTIVNNGIILLNTPDQNRALAFNSAVTVNAGGSLYVTNVNNVQNDESWTLNGGLVKIVGGGHQHFGPIALNGGTITTGPGSYAYDGTAGNYAIDGNVIITGTAPSTLDANTGINLGASVAGGIAVTFNVADATGDGSPDLFVTTKLRDKDGGGSRGIIKTGLGTMLLTVASDYTGDSVISNGVFMLGHALAAQNSTVSNLVSGGLAFSATNTFTIGGLAGNGDIALSNASGAVTLNVGNNGLSTRYDGNLKGSGALIKIGSGTLTLGGLSTYTGVTTISNGTLALIGSGSTANSSTIIIVSNATLDVTGRNGGAMTLASGQTLRGAGNVKGNLIVANGATLSPGTSVGTLTCSNNLTVGNAATLQYELGNNSDRTVVLGNLTLGGTLNISDAGGFTNGIYTLFTYGGTLTYNGVAIGTRPGGSFDYSIDTNTVGQVKLSVTNSVVSDPFVQWQLQYFGCTNCPEAAPTADVTGTGQNNLFKYVTGLDPTNPASIFIFQIASVVGQPNQKNLLYSPVVAGRNYTVKFNTDVVTNGWSSLTGYSGPVTNGSQVTVTDLNATQSNKFYRVSITLP
jgi:autotransporter-associated beta strand protein